MLKAYYEDIRNNSKDKKEDEEEIERGKKEEENKGLKCIKKIKDTTWRYFNKGLLFFL